MLPSEARPGQDPSDVGAWKQAVEECSLAVVLIDLFTAQVISVSPSAAELVGLEPARWQWGPALSDYPSRVVELFDLLTRGVLDGYQGPRTLSLPDGGRIDCYAWVRRLSEPDDRTLALSFLAPKRGDDDTAAPLPVLLAPAAAGPVVVSTTTEMWRFEEVCGDVERLLGYQPAELQGESLLASVHPDDTPDVMMAVAQVTRDRRTTSTFCRMRHQSSDWRPVRMLVCPLGEPATARNAFVISPVGGEDRSAGQRADELEARLWRIALEVQAAGVMTGARTRPDPSRLPELAGLPVRQREILDRLLAGDRVPTIARAMTLSPSTIRNHLTAIYRRMGVHSQSELLDLFHRTE